MFCALSTNRHQEDARLTWDGRVKLASDEYLWVTDLQQNHTYANTCVEKTHKYSKMTFSFAWFPPVEAVDSAECT